jgi:hypothetical protein
MIKPEESGSLYDFVDNNHTAPVVEKAPLVREENWQSSNNERFKRDMPNPSDIEQKDESSGGYWRLFTQQMPKGAFEQSVNIAFGGREAIGGLFREKKVEYVKLYKSMMR